MRGGNLDGVNEIQYYRSVQNIDKGQEMTMYVHLDCSFIFAWCSHAIHYHHIRQILEETKEKIVGLYFQNFWNGNQIKY